MSTTTTIDRFVDEAVAAGAVEVGARRTFRSFMIRSAEHRGFDPAAPIEFDVLDELSVNYRHP